MVDLGELRSEIDDIDRELVKLFEKRMEIALRIADYKRENNIPIFNGDREKEVIRKNLMHLKNKELKYEVEEFFNSIFNISRALQTKNISSHSTEDNFKD